VSEPPDRASYRAARPSVIGPMRTAEVRWVLPGQLDAAVTGWFGASPVELDMSHSQSYADWLSGTGSPPQFTARRVRNPRRADGRIKPVTSSAVAPGRRQT
jgi:hypothetical protein